jgi:hypothetical protein
LDGVVLALVAVVFLVRVLVVFFLVAATVFFLGALFFTGFLSVSEVTVCLASWKRSINRSLSLVKIDHHCSFPDLTISSSFLRRAAGIDSYLVETYAITGARNIHGILPISFIVL